ncbi:hypothetical protein HUJ05_001621 [Dendroctonus ponderosae]|nr:hypothetical protein HUJ05_001621 [Dendroctonus ponderosae]
MIIAKLLRTTEVKNIYLIVRPKEDVGIDKRVTKMFEEQVFLHIPEATFQDKLHPIEGDLKNKSLGIAKEDQIFLRENINIVFHCGASLNMDSKLMDAVMTNVNGTAEILEIMKGAKCLQAFILVSTAYSNCLNRDNGEMAKHVFIYQSGCRTPSHFRRKKLAGSLISSNHRKNSPSYHPPVINFSGNDSPLYISIREYTTTAEKSGFVPFKKTIWKPMLLIVQNKWIFLCAKHLLHTIPAYLLDWLLLITGRKPRKLMQMRMHQVEIVAEELKTETIDEFERIKNEASRTASKSKSDSRNRLEIVLEMLKHDLNELLQEDLNKDFVKRVEMLYKQSIKNAHATQEAAWLLLSDHTSECQKQIKQCYQYACQLVDAKDKTLEKVYKASKEFLKINMKESSKEVKRINARAQEQIMIMCKDAKRRARHSRVPLQQHHHIPIPMQR